MILGIRYSPVAWSFSVRCCHVQEQHVDGIGIAARGVGDHHVHHPVRRERGVPAERLVDARRRAVSVDQQVLRPRREAQVRARQRPHRLHVAGLAARLQERRRQLRIRRLVAEAAGAIDGAQQDLQDVQKAASVKAVGVGGDASHGVHADRPPDHPLVTLPLPVGPGDIKGDLLLERRMGQLGGDSADGGCGQARLPLRTLGRVLIRQEALREQLEHGNRLPAVGEVKRA
jgi:hypothetical protein